MEEAPNTGTLTLEARLKDAYWLVLENGLDRLPGVVELLRAAPLADVPGYMRTTRAVVAMLRDQKMRLNPNVADLDNVITLIEALAWAEIFGVEVHGDRAASFERRRAACDRRGAAMSAAASAALKPS
jgi:hypothetical protein